MINWKHVGLFAGGAVAGPVAIKLFSSDDAKTAYTHCVAAVLRGKKNVLDTVDTLQENCGDIYADAKAINAEREAKKEAAEFEDLSKEDAPAEDAAE